MRRYSQIEREIVEGVFENIPGVIARQHAATELVRQGGLAGALRHAAKHAFCEVIAPQGEPRRFLVEVDNHVTLRTACDRASLCIDEESASLLVDALTGVRMMHIGLLPKPPQVTLAEMVRGMRCQQGKGYLPAELPEAIAFVSAHPVMMEFGRILVPGSSGYTRVEQIPYTTSITRRGVYAVYPATERWKLHDLVAVKFVQE